MKLSKEEVDLFYKLYPALLMFVNQRSQIEEVSSPEALMKLPLSKRFAIRDSLYKNVGLIDEFVQANPEGFSDEELEIVGNWKHYVKGTFYILRQLKKHAIFLTADTPFKAYGVLAITDSFEELFHSFPKMVDTVLMPFQGRIIYDGLINAYNVIFGPGTRRRFNESYDEAKARYGVIASLPHEDEQPSMTDAEQLKFYLKNQSNRERYWVQICDLVLANKENELLFHQEMGKVYAKKLRKQIREAGIESAWFGVLEGVIIASGKNKQDVIAGAKAIAPKDRLDFVYYFRV